MAEQKFKTGDDVVLKSGGPRMTVREYVADGKVQCDWFNGSDDYNNKTFLQDQLDLYESPPNFGAIISGSRRNNHF
jgi:uncharacterized protein YodC (DUF2158 family)